MEGIHVTEVTTPCKPLSVGSKDEPGQVHHGTGWAVLPGNPFGIHQRDRAGGDRDFQLGMQYLLRRMGSINHDLDGSSRSLRGRSGALLGLALGKADNRTHDKDTNNRSLKQCSHDVLRGKRTRLKKCWKLSKLAAGYSGVIERYCQVAVSIRMARIVC